MVQLVGGGLNLNFLKVWIPQIVEKKHENALCNQLQYSNRGR